MKARRCIYGAVFFTGIALQFACENNLRDVEKISAKKLIVPVDKSTGVEIIYSDSAHVKAKLITPELLSFKTEKPYIEMRKGVTVIFFDQNRQETSRVRSDYSIRRERETFKSDELIWDETQKRFFSNKLVSIASKDNILYGTSFWANEDFSYYEIVQSTGDLRLTGEQGF
jgi:hypothetical protein